MKVNKERIILGGIATIGLMSLIPYGLTHNADMAAIYAFVGPMLALIVQFYFRKSPSAESETKNGGTK